jgi:hypothetical protein
MLTLAPMADKAEIENIFREKRIASSEFSGCVTAKNGDEVLGLCLYELTDKKITVQYIEPLNDIPLADGILRSTLHVAAERSVMNAFYADTLPEDFLKKIGFIKDAEQKSLDIDKLFKSCSSCGK